MAKLNTEPNLSRPDDFYESLIALHRDLTPDESSKVNARLILLLANHIGDHEVLIDAMRAAIFSAAGSSSSGAQTESIMPSR